MHFYLFDISIEKFENSATLGYIELCLRKPINKEQVLPQEVYIWSFSSTDKLVACTDKVVHLPL